MKGAASYLLLGPGLPRDGVRITGITYTLEKVPAGPQRWQVASISAAGNGTPTAEFAIANLVVGIP